MNPDTPISSNVQANQNNLPVLVDNVTSQFIVTPPTPNTIGVSGFIFDIIGNEDIMLDSDITDSFTETNISYQDQIALRPEQFTLSGYVGELVNDFSNQFTDVITALANFGIVPNQGPTLNAQDEQYYDQLALTAASINSIVNTAADIYSLFSAFSTTVTRQQNAFQYFYNLWLSRTLCQVETPWGTLENMAILNVRARQDEVTRLITDFSITFKAMRFANTTTALVTSTAPTSPQPSTTSSSQATAVLQTTPDNAGTVAGTSTDNSLLSTYIGNN